MRQKSNSWVRACALMIGLAGLVLSSVSRAETEAAVEEDFRGQAVSFVFAGAVHNIVIRVAGPGNYHASEQFESGSPVLYLSDHGALADGTYRYNMTAALGVAEEQDAADRFAKRDPAQRIDQAQSKRRGISKRGFFKVQNGTIQPMSANGKKP